MKEVYSLGEQEPWRLTKDSAHRLMLAVCKTGSDIISASIDATCPPTHVCVRLRIEQSKVSAFLEHFQDSLDPVEIVSGLAPRDDDEPCQTDAKSVWCATVAIK